MGLTVINIKYDRFKIESVIDKLNMSELYQQQLYIATKGKR